MAEGIVKVVLKVEGALSLVTSFVVETLTLVSELCGSFASLESSSKNSYPQKK